MDRLEGGEYYMENPKLGLSCLYLILYAVFLTTIMKKVYGHFIKIIMKCQQGEQRKKSACLYIQQGRVSLMS